MKNYRHVTGVEQFYWIVLGMSSSLLVVDSDVNLEPLEEVYYHEYENGGDHVVKIWESFSQESLFQRHEFVWLGPDIVEKRDKSSFVLVSFFQETEGFPEKFLAYAGCNEKGDSGYKSVPTLTQNFVK